MTVWIYQYHSDSESLLFHYHETDTQPVVVKTNILFPTLSIWIIENLVDWIGWVIRRNRREEETDLIKVKDKKIYNIWVIVLLREKGKIYNKFLHLFGWEEGRREKNKELIKLF